MFFVVPVLNVEFLIPTKALKNYLFLFYPADIYYFFHLSIEGKFTVQIILIDTNVMIYFF
jgi:hypothetical protein